MAQAEIFHECRSAGIKFTQSEWHDYLNAVYKGVREPIKSTFGRYTFNDHDICLTPDKQEIAVVPGAYGYSIELSWAECGNGLWSFGITYNLGTGGGGYGVAWADMTGNDKSWRNGYPSEKECKVAGWNKALEYIGHEKSGNATQRAKLRLMIQDELKSLTRPQIVQLELF